MTRAISVYSLWSSSTADIYGKSLTREERKKEWDRFEKKHPEDFAKLQRKADRENKKAGVETKKTKATKATKATKKTTKKEAVKCADGVCKKRAPRKQSLATLEKKLVTAEKNLKKATQAVADIEADIKKRKEEEEEDEGDSSSEDEDSSSEDEDSDSDDE